MRATTFKVMDLIFLFFIFLLTYSFYNIILVSDVQRSDSKFLLIILCL